MEQKWKVEMYLKRSERQAEWYFLLGSTGPLNSLVGFFFPLMFLFILFLRVLEDVFQMHIKSKRHNLDEVSKKCLLLNTLSPPVEMLYINAEQQFMADRLLCNLNTRRGETTTKAAGRKNVCCCTFLLWLLFSGAEQQEHLVGCDYIQ